VPFRRLRDRYGELVNYAVSFLLRVASQINDIWILRVNRHREMDIALPSGEQAINLSALGRGWKGQRGGKGLAAID